MKSKEIWKRISNFKDYEVSNHGRVKSFKKSSNGKILVNIIDSRGYYVVNLCQNGMYQKLIHILVAEHFLRPSLDKKIVNHKDLNKLNNYFENLEWCTTRENIHHYCNLTDSFSKYIGVFKSEDSFRVAISVKRKKYSLGCYKKEEDASKIYNTALEIFEKEGFESFLKYRDYIKDVYTSKYSNVAYDKSRKKWVANVMHKGIKIIGKRFDTEEQAIEAVIKVLEENNIPLHYTHLKYRRNNKLFEK